MITLDCHHKQSKSSLDIGDASTTIFPNFTRISNRNIFTHDSLHCGDYIYLGENIGVERSFIEKYTAQIIHHDLSMLGTATEQGRSQGGCPRCPGTPLGEKIPEGEYRFENLLTKIKKFFAGGHPPWHISGYATATELNQEATNHVYFQSVPVERRLLSNIIHAYLVIQLDLSMYGKHIGEHSFFISRV